jgi:hypothetical protein
MYLKDVNIALDHKIVGGEQFQWNCWSNARYLGYQADANRNASVVFNSETQEVYLAEVTHDKKGYAYRWLNPAYKNAYLAECKQREVDPSIVYDDKKFVDLETTEDWLTKANAIFNNKKFDKRVEVPLDLDDETFLHLAREAHNRDITLNKMVEIVLREAIELYGE